MLSIEPVIDGELFISQPLGVPYNINRMRKVGMAVASQKKLDQLILHTALTAGRIMIENGSEIERV